MGKIVAPKDGFYHGVYAGEGEGDESDLDIKRLKTYELAAGRQAAWVYFSHEWMKSRCFPNDKVDLIHCQGAAPFIRLMLRSSTKQYVPETLFTLEKIAAGDFDDHLKAWGHAAAAKGYPMLCEWGTEMNGDWFHWNAKYHGHELGTRLFRECYQRIVELTRKEGANNLSWVFHINHNDSLKGEKPNAVEWNRFENYDPGDTHTDWVGVSIYGPQSPSDPETTSFRDAMDVVYPRLAQIRGKRPILVCELGCTSGAKQVNPLTWAGDALDAMLACAWDGLRGFSWWNEGWKNDDGTCTEMRIWKIDGMPRVFDSRLHGNPKIVDRPIQG
jgi:hypothetical protein